MPLTCENFLVIKLRYIGDVLLSTPVLRALRENFPQSKISMVVNEGTEEVLWNNPCLDQLFVLERGGVLKSLRFLSFLRSHKFDCVIDLTDGDRSALITTATGARMRIGFNHERRWRGAVYTWSLKGEYGARHMVDYHAQALRPLGIESLTNQLELFISDDELLKAEGLLKTLGLWEKKWIMLHPTARYWFKAWPVERFTAVGDAFVKEGFQVVLVGSGDEQNVAHEVIRAAEQTFINLVGKTSLRELGALMKACALFIGNDAGPMHMAAAVGCPVVALFGPTDPAVWGPRGEHVQTIYKGLDCRECFHPGCSRGEMSCMRQISVEEVVSKAFELLL